MNSSIGAGQRRLISTRAARILRDAYGYGYQAPQNRDTMHVNASATGITVTPRSGAFNDFVVVDAVMIGSVQSWRFVVNGTTEIVPQNGSLVTMNGGDGDDQLFVDARTSRFVPAVTVIGGAGNDVGGFQWNENGGYSMGLSGTSLRYVYLHSGPVQYTAPSLSTETLVLISGNNDDGIYIGNNPYQLIQVYSQGGNDFVSGSPPLAEYDPEGVLGRLGTSTTPIMVFGGDGNDNLIGGNGADIMVGGAGNDIIAGKGGRDLLLAGNGIDQIDAVNAGDEDIAIGGMTIFDNDEGALWDIRREWISARTRSQRIANLSGTGSGTRSNGNRFLTQGTTVFPGNYGMGPGLYESIGYEQGLDWLFA